MNRITPPVRTARLHATVRLLDGVGPSGPTIVLRFTASPGGPPSGLDLIQFAQAVARVGVLQSPVHITRSST